MNRSVFCLDCERQLRQCCPQSGRLFYLRTTAGHDLWAWGYYGGPLKRAIAQLKYHNQRQIAQVLGEWLALAWLQDHRQPLRCVVVPIPLHCDRKQQRGYNQAELIATRFCQVAGLPLQPQGLARQRATTAQFGLSIAEREQNLADAFVLGPGLKRQQRSRPVLLLDDIYTTGATTRAAIATLTKAGFTSHGMVSVAMAERDYRQ